MTTSNNIPNSNLLYDPATGLPNMALVMDRLESMMAFCQRYKMSSAICYVRISIPQEMTFENSPELKRVIGERFRQCTREVDSVGIVNKSDYIVTLTDVSSMEVNKIADRIISLLSGEYTIGFKKIILRVSIGICMFPHDAATAMDAISAGKKAMFQASYSGENQYSFYTDNINEAAYRQSIIENDISYALRNNQFNLLFQPQLQLSSHKVLGVETLIRWTHPRLGVIRPDEFIPIAEQTGESNDIFYWLFNQVCKNIPLILINDCELKFSVNISFNQLLLNDFTEFVLGTCQKNNVNPSSIIFEITENIKLYHSEDLKSKLHTLKKEGFKIALDDFGDGYFSFSDLISLPLDYLKFDKHFVKSLLENNKLAPVISPIISMAHNLHLKVIVEGIEELSQYEVWKSLDCDIIQGYLICKPIGINELVHSVKTINRNFASS